MSFRVLLSKKIITSKKREVKMVKRTYQPKKRQRKKVHGFRKRMRTLAGKKVIASRRKKARKRLSA